MKSSTRRTFLTGMGSLVGGLAGSRLVGPGTASADAANPRYLFVLTAFGGASIVDSFLPVAASESAKPGELTTFSDDLLDTVGGLRCVRPLVEEAASDPRQPPVRYAQKSFLDRHGADVAVVTMNHSSVSHPTAQARSLTGGGTADRGRTILETVAEAHGRGLPLPVVNMSSRGFSLAGTDSALAAELRQVAVADPRSFPLGTHGSQGIVRPLDLELLERARVVRGKVEEVSLFSARHKNTHSLQRWASLRERAAAVEEADLVSKLLLTDLPGLPASPDLALIRESLPSVDYDIMQAEAALAFLLVKNRVSCSVSFGSLSLATRELVDGVVTPSVYPPEGFDAAHTSHRVAQSSCWSRVLAAADGLIRLLKTTEDPSRPETSMWDHSLVYFPTDFGRERTRPLDRLAFGTGHHLNNGVLLVSPLIKGNRVYGGVDPDTLLTYGFDRETGEPDKGSVMVEEDLFGAVAMRSTRPFQGEETCPHS